MRVDETRRDQPFGDRAVRSLHGQQVFRDRPGVQRPLDHDRRAVEQPDPLQVEHLLAEQLLGLPALGQAASHPTPTSAFNLAAASAGAVPPRGRTRRAG